MKARFWMARLKAHIGRHRRHRKPTKPPIRITSSRRLQALGNDRSTETTRLQAPVPGSS